MFDMSHYCLGSKRNIYRFFIFWNVTLMVLIFINEQKWIENNQ